MKNKYFKYLYFLILIFVNSNLNAETIFFDSKNIRVEQNGNLIFASNGVANIPLNNLKIKGDKFIYDKLIRGENEY